MSAQDSGVRGPLSNVSLLRSTAVLAVVAVVLAGPAHGYAVEGGTPWQQSQVRAALAASSFDWRLVSDRVVVRIAPGSGSFAVPGAVHLDADLLDAGRFSWGVVLHEFAHQVDFLLLDDAARARLQAPLGGTGWWSVPHGSAAGERFAATLAWAYWPVRDNVMRPEAGDDEAGAMAPAAFRALLAELLRRPAAGLRRFRG